jgi:hypothetical protein
MIWDIEKYWLLYLHLEDCECIFTLGAYGTWIEDV